MPLPTVGVLVDPLPMGVVEQAGASLDRMIDVLWSRQSLGTVPVPGESVDPVLIAFKDASGSPELGLVLQPMAISPGDLPVVTRLAAILLRMLRQWPRPAAAIVEVALAVRLAYRPASPGVASGMLAPLQSKRAMDFMDARLADTFTTADVAAYCGMPPARFSAAFRSTFGVPIRQWVIQRRIELAQALLSNAGVSIETVASACGFSEQCHFTRQFSRVVGLPPGAWRRRNQSLSA
jgi:AraC-like DNA-binding protein